MALHVIYLGNGGFLKKLCEENSHDDNYIWDWG